MLLALIVSILTYTFAYPELGTPLFVCTILRTMDSIMCVMASRIFAVYLMTYVDAEGKLKALSIIGNIIFSVYLILMILNLPLKFVLWYMPDGTYMHGSLFVPIVFTAPVFYLSSGIIMLITRIRSLGFRERVALTVASFVTLFGTIIQAATNGIVLLSLPFGSIGIFVLYFALETSDYHQLQKNNEKLRIAEQDAIKANRAKSDFLASYAESIQDAGQVLLSVINDILDLTKIESGKMELKPAPYSLRGLIGDIGTMIRLRAEQKGLAYMEKMDSAIPDHLIGDELRIRQIMINLLTNAIKYTDSGKVELEVSMQDTTDTSLSLCICVRDTGIGISTEDLPHIFGDFERINEEHNRRIEGTGLGLSIVKRMTGLMNGSISVNSEPGKGSEFTVLIPQKINQEQSAGAVSHTKTNKLAEAITYHTPDCTYLVVDDNRLNLIVATRFLDGLNGQIETASSGEEALQKMRKQKYDLIFMDHMMPELDGIQTYEMSKKDPDNLNTDTPMIMVTANALNGVREEYLNKGFADYISKPLEIKELLRVVRLHLPADKIEESVM